MDQRAHFLPCTIADKDEDLVYSFTMDDVKSLSELKSEPLENQYQLLINMQKIYSLSTTYRFPFTEENMYYDENMLPLIAFRDVAKTKAQDLEKDFLHEYQCMAAGTLSKKYTWKQVKESGLEIIEKDKTLAPIKACATIEELTQLLRDKKEEYCQMIARTKIRVDKKKYQRGNVISRTLLAVFFVALLLTGYYTIFIVPMQRKIIDASNDYIVQDYVGCIDELASVQTNQMGKYTKYILAVCYTKVENFSQEEMKNVAEKLTISSNEKEFDYWISLGRLQFEQAQSIAKALSDDKLLVYAYLKEINALESNTTIDGTEKQSRLDALNQEMQTLGNEYLDEGE